ncbi:lipopolysaccharide heptosyltransferase II [Epilithonimonas hungarica]|uniref:glycosyltransferase family 9 protein n=1 Tax=Epilithonimonas hungarica TaxID=454006 RepID=UPI002781845C|nr:glycosyltransferase family 9 protein [Epilithonimonas hungarica]MDP9954611.1 lipopolysaccharide heptosyltransferase II [Epilithonimonas hungarica]
MPQFNQDKLKKLKKIDKFLSFFLPNRTRKDRYIANVDDKEILIIAFFLIGDTIMFLPALRTIRKNYPYSRITMVCTKVVQMLLPQQGLIDEFIIVDCPWMAPFNKSKTNIIRFFSKIYKINKKKYDICIDFRGDWRNIFYMNFIKSARKISYSSSGGEYMLTDPIVPNDNIVHYTEEGLYLLHQLGMIIDEDCKFPKLYLSDSDEKIIESFKANELLGDQLIIGLHPGVSASADTRKWDEEKFADLIKGINKSYKNIAFVLFEGPNEKETVECIRRELDEEIRFVVVRESLQRYITLLNACDVIVCNDSGAGHLASAFGIPTVVIFGKADPNTVRPLRDSTYIVSHELECKPCNQHICPLGTNECIKSVTTQEVLSLTLEILKKKLNDNKNSEIIMDC